MVKKSVLRVFGLVDKGRFVRGEIYPRILFVLFNFTDFSHSINTQVKRY